MSFGIKLEIYTLNLMILNVEILTFLYIMHCAHNFFFIFGVKVFDGIWNLFSFFFLLACFEDRSLGMLKPILYAFI
jgi:hypothetical protein